MLTASVRVPATSANLGAGFDCIGIAVDRWLSASVEAGDDRVSGESATTINRTGALASLRVEPERDMLFTGFSAACAEAGRAVPKRLAFSASSEIPVARGLGSSSAALVAGARLANAALSLGLGDPELAGLCARIEGHPDNVAPAVFGGAILGVAAGGNQAQWVFASIPVDAGIAFVFGIPPYPVNTGEARRLLPRVVDHGVAVQAAAKSAALVDGLRTGNRALLEIALDDVLHVPYRSHLVPGLAGLRDAARGAGAFGLTLSGSGPTVVAIAPLELAAPVAKTIARRWVSEGIAADTFVQGRPALL
jgi:homoserine kinase